MSKVFRVGNMFSGVLGFIFILLVIDQSVLASSHSCSSFYSSKSASHIHEDITETLYIGVPVKIRPFSANGNKNPLYLVILENPKTQQQMTALFKPRKYGDGDGWNRVPMEYASYGISRLLDLDIIPPVAYRYALTLGGKFFSEGSMQQRSHYPV